MYDEAPIEEPTMAQQIATLTQKKVELAELNERMRRFQQNKRYIESLPSKGDPEYPKDVASIDQMIEHLQYCRRCLDEDVPIVPLMRPTQSRHDPIDITEFAGSRDMYWPGADTNSTALQSDYNRRLAALANIQKMGFEVTNSPTPFYIPTGE